MRGGERRRKDLAGFAKLAEKRVLDREKKEKKRAEQAEKERLKALKANDMDAYFKHLQVRAASRRGGPSPAPPRPPAPFGSPFGRHPVRALFRRTGGAASTAFGVLRLTAGVCAALRFLPPPPPFARARPDRRDTWAGL